MATILGAIVFGGLILVVFVYMFATALYVRRHRHDRQRATRSMGNSITGFWAYLDREASRAARRPPDDTPRK